MSNCYATLDDLKTVLNISDTSSDALLLRLLESASRAVDDWTGRFFYVWHGKRYFDGPITDTLFIDDLLSLTTLKTDTDQDRVYDDETWSTTDYYLYPANEYPKTRIVANPSGTYVFPTGEQVIEIDGAWGYGNGESPTPYSASGIDCTADDTAGATVTVSAEGTIKAGHTILVDSEQMFVTAVTTDGSKQITVERAANGTTAAVHSGAEASIYEYPGPVRTATLEFAVELYARKGRGNLKSEKMGDYSYTAADATVFFASEDRALFPYRVMRFA